MNKIQFVAQLVGICGMISLFVMYQQSGRRKYLCFKLLSDILWAAHYFLLSAIGGAIPNLVGIVRELVFMNDNKKWANRKIWVPVFIVINATLALSFANSLIHFVPICASALVTVSLSFKKTTNIRLLTIPISGSFLIYDIVVGSFAGALNETISLLSMISKLIVDYKRNKII